MTIKDNGILEEDCWDLSGSSNNSSCYPLLISFKDVRLSDVLPLLNSISKHYSVRSVHISNYVGGDLH